MPRLLLDTGVRGGEECGIPVGDADFDARIRFERGEGSSDRCVRFGKSFAIARWARVTAHPSNRYLFQTRRHTEPSVRPGPGDLPAYAESARVTCIPHTVRYWSRSSDPGRPRRAPRAPGASRRAYEIVYARVPADHLDDRSTSRFSQISANRHSSHFGFRAVHT